MKPAFVEIAWRGRPLRLEVAWVGASASSQPTVVFLHEGLGSVAMWKDFPARLDVILVRGDKVADHQTERTWKRFCGEKGGHCRVIPAGPAAEVQPLLWREVFLLAGPRPRAPAMPPLD